MKIIDDGSDEFVAVKLTKKILVVLDVRSLNDIAIGSNKIARID